MNSQSFPTLSLSSKDVVKDWVVIDATNLVVGRLCSQVVNRLRGKHKPTFTPNIDCGDRVVIINAEKIRFTGKKMTDKVYVSHTGYPGGQRFKTPREVLAKDPRRIIEHGVRGMLPKNRLGRKLFTNLYVYAGEIHPHEAQNPATVTLVI